MQTTRLTHFVPSLIMAFVAGWLFGGINTVEAQALPHFKCYVIEGTDPTHVVELTDQFAPRSTERVRVGRARFLCAPVQKRVVSGPAPRSSTGDHLKCYSVVASRTPTRPVSLANQLGREAGVRLFPARLLYVPTMKRLE